VEVHKTHLSECRLHIRVELDCDALSATEHQLCTEETRSAEGLNHGDSVQQLRWYGTGRG